MPQPSTLGSSSGLYPILDDREDPQTVNEKGIQHSDGAKTLMDMSGSEALLSDHVVPYNSVPIKAEPKRKRDTLTSQVHHDDFTWDSLEHRNPAGEDVPPDAKRRKISPSKPFQGAKQGTQNQTEDKVTLEIVTVCGLPISLWQIILGFVPPIFLGRILRVSKVFHALLEKRSRFILEGIDAGDLDPNAIWRESRKRFAPGLPRNLPGFSDLDMWRLLRGIGCQLCGERFPLLTASNLADPWRPISTDEKTVRVVWPFGIRCCSDCLVIRIKQDRELLLSSTFPSFLLPALPFAFITESQHYIPSSTVKRFDCPQDMRLSKTYYAPHVEGIKKRFVEARELGSGSTEEWVKGLEAEGSEKSSRVATWEQWESKGGLNKVNLRPGSRLFISKRDGPPNTRRSLSDIGGSEPHSLLVQSTTDNSHASSSSDTAPTTNHASTFGPIGSSHSGHPPTSVPRTMVSSNVLPQRPVSHLASQRHERTLQDVNEAKVIRRAEIERRCEALVPPITPNLLRHMESFQAALQITTPLTDRAWEVLRPRLEAQWESAVENERECAQQVQAIKAEAEDIKRFKDTTSQTDADEATNRDTEHVHASLRDRLSLYADEAIHNQWGGGRLITKENCSKFAADVLLYVRRRFYEGNQQLDETKNQAKLATEDPGKKEKHNEKLTLEHMKWIFDSKIKCLTEQFQRELFMCNGCEGNTKFYGFEAVIQHYAAKHTTSLSHGSVVVHWRAEWPDPPPFDPSPSLANTAFYAIPTPMGACSSPLSTNIHSLSKPSYGETVNNVTGSSSTSAAHGQLPGSCRTELYSQYPTYTIPQTSVVHGSSVPLPFAYSTSQPLIVNEAFQYPTQAVGPAPQTTHIPYQMSPRSMHPGYSSGQYGFTASTSSLPGVQLYLAQKEEMAKQARDVWFATSGIKDLPQSLRVYVVIQHVVARFEKKYTNEPGLSMFVDGLDHSALMRPVRSLNGLACKSCVVSTTLNSANDRKLYTLPHLLNHFRSAHLEKVQPTIDLQTGTEPARLDWKKDMIELPETHLIVELIHAPGMTDEKLSLIASVLPGVFPKPLPSVGSAKSSGPIPKYGAEPNNVNLSSNLRTSLTDNLPTLFQAKESSLALESHSWSHSNQANRSPGQPDTELAREDEYDPHRPNFFGRIMEPHQQPHSSYRSATSCVGESLTTEHIGTHFTTGDSREGGPYGSQLLRHMDNSGRGHDSQNGIVVEDLPIYSRASSNYTPRMGEASNVEVAAENFLRDLNPNINGAGRASWTLQNSPSKVDTEHSDYPSSKADGIVEAPSYLPVTCTNTSAETSYHYSRDEIYSDYPLQGSHRIKYVYADNGRPFQGTLPVNSSYSYTRQGQYVSDNGFDHQPRPVDDKARYERLELENRSKSPSTTSLQRVTYGRGAGASYFNGILQPEKTSRAVTDSQLTYIQPRYNSNIDSSGTSRRFEYIPVSPNDRPQYLIRYEHYQNDGYEYEEAPVQSRRPIRGDQTSGHGIGPAHSERASRDSSSPNKSYRAYR